MEIPKLDPLDIQDPVLDNTAASLLKIVLWRLVYSAVRIILLSSSWMERWNFVELSVANGSRGAERGALQAVSNVSKKARRKRPQVHRFHASSIVERHDTA